MKKTILICILIAGVLPAMARNVDSNTGLKAKPQEKVIVGKPIPLGDNTFRCKGKNGVCAVINDSGSTMEMTIYWDEGAQSIGISSYSQTSGIEDGEQYVDIEYVPN